MVGLQLIADLSRKHSIYPPGNIMFLVCDFLMTCFLLSSIVSHDRQSTTGIHLMTKREKRGM